MTDDYYDYLHNVDVLKKEEQKHEYAGGSGVLVEGKISLNSMKIAFCCFYAITGIIGLYLFLELGYVILLFGLIGFFSSYYYTAPPISFGYRGFGELAIFLNLGPLITIGAYYLQAHNIPFNVIIMSLPIGFLVFSMIVFNEIPDFKTDLMAGKRTLVVLFGKKIGFILGVAAIVSAYITLILSVVLSYSTTITLITLSTVPLAYKAITLLKNSLHLEKSEGQLELIKTHNYVGMLLIISYTVQAFINGTNIGGGCIVIITSLVLYLPILAKFYF